MSFRGTLSNNGETSTANQFAGQQAASQLLQDNRGSGIRYTSVLSSNLTNNANLGVTRIGYSQTGSMSPSFALAPSVRRKAMGPVAAPPFQSNLEFQRTPSRQA